MFLSVSLCFGVELCLYLACHGLQWVACKIETLCCRVLLRVRKARRMSIILQYRFLDFVLFVAAAWVLSDGKWITQSLLCLYLVPRTWFFFFFFFNSVTKTAQELVCSLRLWWIITDDHVNVLRRKTGSDSLPHFYQRVFACFLCYRSRVLPPCKRVCCEI